MNQLPTAEVDADVADRRVVEDQIAGLRRGTRDASRRCRLCPGVARQVDASLAPGIVRQTGTVERDARIRSGVAIRNTELVLCGLDRDAGEAGNRRDIGDRSGCRRS